ncbi:MAG: alpha/beta hydrolase [Ramlibacter sp.]
MRDQNRSIRLFFVALLLAASSFTTLAQGTRVLRDVPYGADARQRFDVYLPARPAGPVILLVHGGAWAFGDKASPDVLKNKLRHWVDGLGYVLVSTNYRLLPAARPLEQAGDVARALALVQKEAPQWGADPKRLVLMGHSAGAHLAMLLHSAPALVEQAGAQRWRVTVSLDSAALDVEQLMRAPHARLYDRAFGKDPAYWQAVSPYHQVSAPGAPALLMVCSRLRDDDPCGKALHYEKKAAHFGHYITIWGRDLSHADINRQLGAPGMYTDLVTNWLTDALKP